MDALLDRACTLAVFQPSHIGGDHHRLCAVPCFDRKAALMDGVSELYVEIAQWAESRGAHDLASHDGLWTGETDQWKVEINGHHDEIDDLPFAHARLTHKTYVQMAILSPFEGALVGASEDSLINHFRAAREAQP